MKKIRNFISNLNLLLSAEFPNDGDAARLTRLLELLDSLQMPPAPEYRGPSDERFMFRAATVNPDGGHSVRLLAAIGVVVDRLK